MPSLAKVAIRPVFAFTGIGPQWWAMGHQLLAQEPTFRRVAEQCDALFQRFSGWSIIAEMSADESQSLIDSAHIAHPANFLLQAGLTALWRERGVEPAAIVGHSSGEVAAAYAAGVLSLKDGMRLTYDLSRLVKKRVPQGRMLAVALNAGDALKMLREHDEHVCIAAVNSPSAVTLAGEAKPLERIAARMDAQGIFNRFLRVDVAYHSEYIEALGPELLEAAQTIQLRTPAVPFYSTVVGRAAGEELVHPEYWCANTRRPVLFEQAMDSLIDDGHRVFVEVGPHPVLATSIKECLAERGVHGTVVTSLRRGEPERRTLFEAHAILHAVADSAAREGYIAEQHCMELAHIRTS